MYMLSNDARIVAMLLVAFSFSTQKSAKLLECLLLKTLLESTSHMRIGVRQENDVLLT